MKNEAFFIRVWKPSLADRFKNLEGRPGREIPKRTISASSGLGPLQMVSKQDIGRCASEEAKPRRGVDTRRCASKDAGLQRGRLRGPTLIGEMNECQRECWAPKRGGL